MKPNTLRLPDAREKFMLLNSEELLALMNGDVEPDRLADLLDRLEHCSESADALQVLVALRANREQALSALHDAQERDVVASVMPHPATIAPAANVSWASQGLRLAATIAIVAVISAWAASSYLGVGESVATSRLATTTFESIVTPNLLPSTVLTADNTQALLSQAHTALHNGNYEEAKRILNENPQTRSTAPGLLYLGMSHYFTQEYNAAVSSFDELRRRIDNGEDVESSIPHQTAWYLANALLALDRQMAAMDVLEEIQSEDGGYWFHGQATDLYTEVRAAMGLTSLNPARD